MSKKVVIIGPPGAGKSSVGRVLSDKYGLKVTDLDALVEKRVGRAVSEIIRVEGINTFRALETEALVLGLDADYQVVVLGGGTLTVEQNRNLIKEKAFSIRLNASFGELLNRVEREEHLNGATGSVRPLLVQPGKTIAECLECLLAERESYYSQADLTIWTDYLSPEGVGALILKQMEMSTDNQRDGCKEVILAAEMRPGSFFSEVLIGPISSIADKIRARFGEALRIVLLIDKTVERAWGKRLREIFGSRQLEVFQIVIESGETSKTLTQLEQISDKMLAFGISRSDVLVACGGGVVGDIGGLTASLYSRGMNLVHVPTTLMAQVDSAIGGKTAVNLAGGKNSLGTFYPASITLIDAEFLTTLPDREYLSGLSEVVKYGLIHSPSFFSWFENKVEQIKNRDVSCLKEIVEFSSRTKFSFVANDLEDRLGKRVLLNFGHTVGHALERLTGYKRFLHGEALAIGMMEAIRLGIRKGATPKALLERLERILKALNLPQRVPLELIDSKYLLRTCGSTYCDSSSAASVIWEQAIAADKKRDFRTIKFVVVKGEGNAVTLDVSPADVVSSVLAGL